MLELAAGRFGSQATPSVLNPSGLFQTHPDQPSLGTRSHSNPTASTTTAFKPLAPYWKQAKVCLIR